MTTDVVHELLDLLPSDCSFLRGLTSRVRDIPSNAERARIRVAKTRFGLMAPDLGFQFVYALIDDGRPYPTTLNNLPTREVYDFLNSGGSVECDAEQAIALRSPEMESVRSVLHAMLINHRVPWIHIFETFSSFTPSALVYYSELNFNVRERIHDTAYIRSLLYPDSRRAEFCDPESYIRSESLRYILMRMSLTYGIDNALVFAGYQDPILSEADPLDASRRLESLTMHSGLQMAKLGFLHHRTAPAIQHARQLITAGKLGGSDEGSEDRMTGFGALSDRHPVLDDMNNIRNVRARMASATAEHREDLVPRPKILPMPKTARG